MLPVIRLSLVIPFCLWLAGCASETDESPWLHKNASAPNAAGSNQSSASASPLAPPSVGKIIEVAAQSVTVQTGDTLPQLSRRYGVSIRHLIEANTLVAPYDLATGQTLSVPAHRTYVVGAGDSLSAVARTTGAKLSALTELNGLQQPFTIRSGQRLALPTEPMTRTVSALPASSSPSVAKPSPSSATVNGDQAMPKPAGGASVAKPAAPPVAPTPPATSSTVVPPPSAATQSAATQSAATQSPASSPPTPSAPSSGELAAIPPRTGRAFDWPLTGTLLAKYGPGAAEGTSNPGINIAAPVGSSVHAAENGVVAYAGNELAGFGNLLLVKHAGGWMTVYAHNQQLLVAKGAVVKRGQVIAKSGHTGKVDQPQLHFEVRKDADSVDPLDYLKKL